ncbi:hypothetical protein Val02_33180 [Virgisporangium aliadipatigenens]|uniref:Cytochrome P450 n=1 Tax=Virgisporangium aliadipatigenens TaxID=741659 RepID=A0A8J3YLC9_9ACTN|nr:hypothetical protein [Virgisporangium aliadipatigenens]GIJ46432.1 hypothetical protein Val02_33180 [Virgisporangium aliadipatigenens]
MRTFTTHSDVAAVLEDPTMVVPPPPPGPGAMAWLRARVARFSAGEEHARRRRDATDLLDALDPTHLRASATAAVRTGTPLDLVTAEVLTAALGLPGTARLVATAAAGYLPGGPEGPEVDAAVAALRTHLSAADAHPPEPDNARLLGGDGSPEPAGARRLGGSAAAVLDGVRPPGCGGPAEPGGTSTAGDDEAVAAMIGVLLQANNATAALIRAAAARGGDVAAALREDPPARSTRRQATTDRPGVRAGALVTLDLASAGLPFGAGAHACPGRTAALAIAEGALSAHRPPEDRDEGPSGTPAT